MDFSRNHDCQEESPRSCNVLKDIGENDTIHLQELLHNTCKYANQVNRSICETVDQCLNEKRAMGDTSNRLRDDVEKDLLFTEVTTKSTDYYRGLVQDKLCTRKDILDKTEQDMAESFNNLFCVIRKIEDSEAYSGLYKELQNLRALMKVLQVAAERFGVSNSEARFLCDLEKVVRCIECMNRQHEKAICEIGKLRLVNHELNQKANSTCDDCRGLCHTCQQPCQDYTMQQPFTTSTPCRPEVISHAAPCAIICPPANPKPCQECQQYQVQPCDRKRRNKTAKRVCLDNSIEPEPDRPENYPSPSPSPPPPPPPLPPPPAPPQQTGIKYIIDSGLKHKESCDVSVGGCIYDCTSVGTYTVESDYDPCPPPPPTRRYSTQIIEPPAPKIAHHYVAACEEEQLCRCRRLFRLGLALLALAAVLLLLSQLWSWYLSSETITSALCTKCSPICKLDHSCTCFPNCDFFGLFS